MCHGVGMGLPPSPQESEEQLGNIDCLACHAKPDVYVSGVLGIKLGLKNVTKDDQGRWRYVINVPTEELAKSIINRPQSKNCLACHAFSGGGPHLKRPNIAPDLLNPELAAEFDVHFKAGLGCTDCHSGENHEFGTNSVDTWSREGEVPKCSNCHTEDPHNGFFGYFLNTFHDRVACQTCHIPTIAHGEYPTEYYRDWTVATFLPKEKRWKFAIPDPESGDYSKWYLFNNLQPSYAWYNGDREVYIFPTPVEPVPVSEVMEKVGGKYEASQIKAGSGEVVGAIYYVKPTASKEDGDAKIYPFKVHVAVVPYSEQDRVPVPVKAGIAFATGNITMAMAAGAKDAGVTYEPGKAVLYVRYMQVNHGVQPKEKALFCFDCHNIAEGRMHWEDLGYGIYPKVAFGGIIAGILAVVLGAVWLIRRRGS
ncbi:cytochrome c3 family protein [Archaeoglobus fulgidus]|nr:cytochrome c3 family protein [Archaeoglobus fulgidus]